VALGIADHFKKPRVPRLSQHVRRVATDQHRTIFFKTMVVIEGVRAKATSVLISETGDILVGAESDRVFAYSLTTQAELWSKPLASTHELYWLNQGRWVFVVTRSFYYLLECETGTQLYRSHEYASLEAHPADHRRSLIAIDRGSKETGWARELAFVSLSRDGSYLESYEEHSIDRDQYVHALAADLSAAKAFLLLSPVDNNRIGDARLKQFHVSFGPDNETIHDVSEQENEYEVDPRSKAIAAQAGRLIVGGDLVDQKIWLYEGKSPRQELFRFTGGANGFAIDKADPNTLFAIGSEQTFNRQETNDFVILDLAEHQAIRRWRVPAWGHRRLSRMTSEISVAGHRVALSLADNAAFVSGDEQEPVIPAFVVLEFP
jgi:hypothetical protein